MIVDCIFFDKNDFVFFSNKLLLWEFVEVERVCIWKECIYGKSLCCVIEILSYYVVINIKSDIV